MDPEDWAYPSVLTVDDRGETDVMGGEWVAKKEWGVILGREGSKISVPWSNVLAVYEEVPE